ncbi:MAG: hypothetical protein QM820_04495 [Minicystis sp.]
MKKYKSPMVEARAIRSEQVKTASPKLKALAKRMVELPAWVIVDLEQEQAPKSVFRWVTGGAEPTMQRRRAELAIHLRRVIARPLGGWLEERHLSAALAVVEAEVAAARKRGGIARGVKEIPLDAYQAAIDAATKTPRGQGSDTELEDALDLDDEPEAPDGKTNEEERAEAESEEGQPPVSEPLPTGRTRVLRQLSDAIGLALEAGDMEAAMTLTVTVSVLCKAG